MMLKFGKELPSLEAAHLDTCLCRPFYIFILLRFLRNFGLGVGFHFLLFVVEAAVYNENVGVSAVHELLFFGARPIAGCCVTALR